MSLVRSSCIPLAVAIAQVRTQRRHLPLRRKQSVHIVRHRITSAAGELEPPQPRLPECIDELESERG